MENEDGVEITPYEWFRLVRWVVAIILAIILVAGVSDWIVTTYFVHVSSGLQRQRLNHDPAWERAREQEIVDDYTKFVAVQQKLPADRAACMEFVAVHGPSRNWSYTEDQQWHELYDVTYQGDYQTEVSEAQDYNAHQTNPDQRPDIWPSGLPKTLNPDPAPQPILGS